MTTELRKLRAELTDQRTENERLSTKLAKKNNGMTELQAQLGRVKMEAQVQLKQLQQRKEIINEANTQITRLMEQLKEGPQKAMLHIKKIVEKFRKQTEEDVEVATTTALQQWCGQAAELQVLWVDKANRNLKGFGLSKLDKDNAEAVQANLKADFQRIAITHHEEIEKLLSKQREYVEQIAKEAFTVAEPVLSVAEENILHTLEDDEEDLVRLLYIA